MNRTLAEFASVGAWDCSHAIDACDMREAWCAIGCPTDPEAALNVVREAWRDAEDGKADWLAQQDGFDGLDPEACWRAWSSGWQARAVSYVRGWMPAWAQARQEERA